MAHRKQPKIGPALQGTALPEGEMMQGSIPSPKNAGLWMTQAVSKLGLPPEMQEMMKYLPLVPKDKMGTGVKSLTQILKEMGLLK